MIANTYQGYKKDYYHKNREKILARTRRYRILSSREYYEEHREQVLARMQAKRDRAKAERKATGVQLEFKF